MGNGAIVKEDIYLSPGWEVDKISPGGVDTGIADISPVLNAYPAHPFGLVRGQDGKFDAQLGHDIQSLKVYGRLRQPHPFRLTPEAVLEIPYSPHHLAVPVAVVGQRHDDMVVGLGHRRAMPGKVLPTLPVGLDNRPVDIRAALFHPVEESGAEVKAHPGIVADNPVDITVFIQNPR